MRVGDRAGDLPLLTAGDFDFLLEAIGDLGGSPIRCVDLDLRGDTDGSRDAGSSGLQLSDHVGAHTGSDFTGDCTESKLNFLSFCCLFSISMSSLSNKFFAMST